MKKTFLFLVIAILCQLMTVTLMAQNVGIGTTSPVAKLHIKGSQNATQLFIDANTTQTNATAPLIKLRTSGGTDLMWIHSDDTTNTFIGLKAGKSNTATGGGAGAFNTFIGSLTGIANVNGNQNTAIGYSALYKNTLGNLNTAVGDAALFSNTSGSINTAVGVFTLTSNTDGNYNTAIGDNTLNRNTNGNSNTALGSSALNNNTKGNGNTASGSASLYYNTTSNLNVAMGEYAMYIQSYSNSNTIYDGNNVGIGCYALYANQPTSSSNGIKNTAIGNNSLATNATGSKNTAIGYYADVNAANLTNATAIGYNAKVGASNSLVLGATGNDAVKVGIGTSTPQYPIDVTGDVVYRVGNFKNATTNADRYGVYGTCSNSPWYGIGAYGEGGYIGVSGQALIAGEGTRYGVYGVATGGTGGNWAIYSSGSSYATGTWQTSDEMFKKDVHPVENALDKLKQLEPRSYNFKTTEYSYMGLPSEPQYGFLAQDMERVFPELVRSIEQPIDHTFKEKTTIQFKGINYTELIPVTIAAIQEQQQTIDELKNQVAALTALLEAAIPKK